MPWTDSSTISAPVARSPAHSDPDDRRTLRSIRFPSSSETSRARKPSRDTTPPIR
jgi:hypothetical protein